MRPLVKAGEPAELQGSVLRVVYSNPENHWTVLRLSADGRPGEVTVVGTLAGIGEGERLRIWGRWIRDPRYGLQVEVERSEVVLPATAVGIERYLGSGQFPGFGPKTAKLLVKRFGDKTLDVIDKNPERLRSVKGIGKKRVAQLIRAWREQTGLRDVMTSLLQWGITPALAARIFREYGVEAVGRVRSNPYELAQRVHGIGFLRADRIAGEIGIRGDDPARLRAGLLHTLRESRSEGHACIPRATLLEAGEALLGCPADLLGTELTHLEDVGRIVVEPAVELDGVHLVYSPDLHQAERRVARSVVELLDLELPPRPPELLDVVMMRAESSVGVALADEQRRAVRVALMSRVAVITGGPGTGKTTIVRAIAEALEGLGESLALCAPTGRAAKRLSGSTGRQAKTIHRLLEWAPQEGGFTRNLDRPLEVDAVIADEMSMVDLPLFDQLLLALSAGSRLILVGDVDQLPSVGPGSVLRDVIASEAVPVVSLEHIFRQAQGSLITANAHRILRGELPEVAAPGEIADFYWIEKDDPDGILDIIERMVCGRIQQRFGLDPIRDVQVLTPMHRGPIGSEGLNRRLGARLNPDRDPQRRLAPGDKVMQIRNNYDKEVFNGDVGFVERLAEDGETLLVRFDEPDVRIKRYEHADQDQLVPAWAISIHKSQGSEYPAVIIPVHGQHYVMLRRNLVYTAVTRGKRLVILVGNKRALGIALRASTVSPRFGQLAQRLKEAVT